MRISFRKPDTVGSGESALLTYIKYGTTVIEAGSGQIVGADPGISVKGVHMYNGAGVRFADFISIFLNIP